MKPNKIAIMYKGVVHFLNRVTGESKHYQIAFETDRWSIRFYLLQNGQIRIIINKSIKKSETEYHTHFCYDCYCTLDKNGLFLDDVHDPATCRKITNPTKWFTIEPMLRDIHNQLKEELEALHPFDLIHDIRDLVHFIYRKMEEYGKVEFTVNNSLRFGIGENAYTTSEEALKAKEKEPVVLLNLFNGNHIISKDTIIFFLYWLLDRDKELSVSDGQKLKTVVRSFEESPKKPNEWSLQTLNTWWQWLSFDEFEDITGIEQDRDGNNEIDAKFLDDANQFWQNKTFQEKIKIYQSNSHLHEIVKERIEAYE